MEEATKKPSKYKLAEVMGNLVLNPDRENSWNAVRSLRSMAATVVSSARAELSYSPPFDQCVTDSRDACGVLEPDILAALNARELS